MRLPSWSFNRQESVHNYSGILVPLEEAHLHSHSARAGKSEFEESPGEDADEDAEAYDGLEADAVKDQENESTGMLQMSAAEYTIDGLRREVRKGGGRAGHSEYECKRPLHEPNITLGLNEPHAERTRRSKIQAHKQGHTGHWDGSV